MKTAGIKIVTTLLLSITFIYAQDQFPEFTQATASNFARLALENIQREYPNKLSHVLNDSTEILSPRTLHPAFYGCFDWHSSVHGHWMLVRILRLFPELPERHEIRAVLNQNLSAVALEHETAYLQQAGRKSFERTYGWAWLLKLAGELHQWDDPDARQWFKNMDKLSAAFVQRYLDFLPKQTYPIRRGVHPNTAFGLTFALDYAREVDDTKLEQCVLEAAKRYFSIDKNAPAAWEPDGDDFLSPSLVVAELMHRVLSLEKYQKWLSDFLPELADGKPENLLRPAKVSDRKDPKIVHLDGLNLSRAWCMLGIASKLPEQNPVRLNLLKSAANHARATLPHISNDNYEGGHWLASFAVYMFTRANLIKWKRLLWEDLPQKYNFPTWYTEARFGIWVHWGAQSQPREGGGWYARHMYMPDVGRQLWGLNAYRFHQKTYGHQSEIGYKDVIRTWKAENLDTDALLAYFKSLGAKYFVALANHHDHFDNFNSTYHPWNSVAIGPKIDIIGEFKKSAVKYDIPFGVSSHDDRFLSWWLPAFGADSSGAKKGVPYDGNMTKKDGKGRWWEGLNPADLYGLPPEKRTPEYIEGVKKNWAKRTKELVTKYDVDMIWFDGGGFPYGKYGKMVCTDFFNYKLNKYGKINSVIVGKFHNEPSLVKDIESGGANKILPIPWQSILTLRSWFYKEDPQRHYKHNARTIIEMMSDIISKNGNLLLNVELMGDGTVPPEQKPIYDDIGAWVNLNAEAIYASKPWKIYGDNINSFLQHLDKNISEADLEQVKKQADSEQFNERKITDPPYYKDEVRFTTKGDTLYIFVLNPEKGEISIPSLGRNSRRTILAMTMIGSNAKIKFRQKENKLILKVPAKRPDKYTTVFKAVCKVQKPNILIIGDSISLGYTPFVIDNLTNKAIVTHNKGNARHTGYGLQKLYEWITDDKWDIIQFNWGLWDLCYRHPDSKIPGKRDKITGKITYDLDEYTANLDSIISKIRMKTKAKLVFVTTTYVPENEAGRFTTDAIKYNKAAKAVMAKNGIYVNDIYEKSIKIHHKYGKGSDNVHYSSKGYEELGKLIADFLITI